MNWKRDLFYCCIEEKIDEWMEMHFKVFTGLSIFFVYFKFFFYQYIKDKSWFLFLFRTILGRAEPPSGVGDPCAGCNKPILDKFLLNVLERVWHASCVRCCECQQPLTDKCFSRESKLYCRSDFFRWVKHFFFTNFCQS